MATLRKRLERLEGKCGGAGHGPAVIFLCDADTGEPFAALMKGGGGATRKPGETLDAFAARAQP